MVGTFFSICWALFLTDFLASGRRMMPSDCGSFPLKSVINLSTLIASSWRSCGLVHEYVMVFKVVLARPALMTSRVSVMSIKH